MSNNNKDDRNNRFNILLSDEDKMTDSAEDEMTNDIKSNNKNDNTINNKSDNIDNNTNDQEQEIQKDENEKNIKSNKYQPKLFKKYQNFNNNKHIYYDETGERNHKKILCNNILKYEYCNYGFKCLYAHSLDEQNVEPIRKKAYDIIKSPKITDEMNIKNDTELIKILLSLTKVCEECINRTCPGGYNCKYGVFSKKYQLCYNDLMYGRCVNTSCVLIHLTQKGFIPLKQDFMKNPRFRNSDTTNINDEKNKDIGKDNNKDPHKNLNKEQTNMTNKTSLIINKTEGEKIPIPDPVLLTTDFFFNVSDKNDKKEFDDISDSEESIEYIKQYLDEPVNKIDPCETSIFL